MSEAPEKLWMTAEEQGWPGSFRSFRLSDLEHPEEYPAYVRADLYEQVKRDNANLKDLLDDARSGAAKLLADRIRSEATERLAEAQVVTDAMVAAFQDKYREFWKGSWPDTETSRELLKAALAEPAGEAEPDFAASIAEVIKEESLNEAACGWRSCTGCHETNEGCETGRCPYSTMFGCHVGHGCSECGGLGVVWEYWSKDALDSMANEVTTPPDASAIRGALERIVKLRKDIVSDVGTAHKLRGSGASDWMREDDRDFRRDLNSAFDAAEAALAGAKP